MPRPSVRSQANAAGQAAVTLTPPAGHQVGDLIIIAIETANETVVATAFNTHGYTLVSPGVGGPHPGQGTAAAANATRLTIYWRRAANTTMPAVSTGDSGDHQSAAIIIIQNANTTIDPPWETAANLAQTTNSTTLDFNSLTTTNANTLIFHAAGLDTDVAGDQVSAPTNGNLTNLTEWTDAGTNAQDGGCIAIITGDFAGSGSTGNTTATLATTEIYSTWTAAILGTPDPTAKPWARAVIF
jgi:hypothetical protein